MRRSAPKSTRNDIFDQQEGISYASLYVCVLLRVSLLKNRPLLVVTRTTERGGEPACETIDSLCCCSPGVSTHRHYFHAMTADFIRKRAEKKKKKLKFECYMLLSRKLKILYMIVESKLEKIQKSNQYRVVGTSAFPSCIFCQRSGPPQIPADCG